MVEFLVVKRNYLQYETLSDSELAFVEQICDDAGVDIKFETIDGGVIIYFGNSFTEEECRRVQDHLKESVQILDPDNLPAQYNSLYNSITAETTYYALEGVDYFEFVRNMILHFVKNVDAVHALEQVYRRRLH